MNIKEFAKRRTRLMHMIGNGSIVIMPSAPVRYRNRDVEYSYRPDSDFYYLTGFPEPEAVAVLIPGRKQGEFILFCRERDPKMEVWTGPRIGQERASSVYGADDAFPMDDIDDILPGLLEDREKVYYTMGSHQEFDHRIMDWLNQIRQKSRAGIHTPAEFVALDHVLHEMRLFKNDGEVRAMRQAAKIAALGHCRAMRACRPGMMEYQIEAELLHEFIRHGSRSPAYPSIVGGGSNACIHHYTDNSAVLNDGDLLLIDAGAEYDSYASDITRTFPVNGRFSKVQAAIYEIVLAAQLAAIKKIKPGNHWNDPHHAAVRELTKGLVELGLLKGNIRKLIKEDAYRRFYMHRTGH